jgi:hypothetical protein
MSPVFHHSVTASSRERDHPASNCGASSQLSAARPPILFIQPEHDWNLPTNTALDTRVTRARRRNPGKNTIANTASGMTVAQRAPPWSSKSGAHDPPCAPSETFDTTHMPAHHLTLLLPAGGGSSGPAHRTGHGRLFRVPFGLREHVPRIQRDPFFASESGTDE